MEYKYIHLDRTEKYMKDTVDIFLVVFHVVLTLTLRKR